LSMRTAGETQPKARKPTGSQAEVQAVFLNRTLSDWGKPTWFAPAPEVLDAPFKGRRRKQQVT
jgi:hypothetical protein